MNRLLVMLMKPKPLTTDAAIVSKLYWNDSSLSRLLIDELTS